MNTEKKKSKYQYELPPTGVDLPPFSMKIEDFYMLVRSWKPDHQYWLKYREDFLLSEDEVFVLTYKKIADIHRYLINKNQYFTNAHIKNVFFGAFWQQVIKTREKKSSFIQLNRAVNIDDKYKENFENTPIDNEDDERKFGHYESLERAENESVSEYLEQCLQKLEDLIKNPPETNNKQQRAFLKIREDVKERYLIEKNIISRETLLLMVLVSNNEEMENISFYLDLKEKDQTNMLSIKTDLNLVRKMKDYLRKNSLYEIVSDIKNLSDFNKITESRQTTKKELLAKIKGYLKL